MSEKNVERVRRLIEAWNRNEPDTAIGILDPGVVLDATRRLVNPKIYTGIRGMRRMLADTHEVWEEFRMEPDEVVGAGDRVVAIGRWVGRGAGSGLMVRTAGGRRVHPPGRPRGSNGDRLYRPRRGTRSRWAIGLGDVVRERRDRPHVLRELPA